MDEDGFWAIIQRCHDASTDDMDRKGRLVKDEIGRLSVADAAAFGRHFEVVRARAYRHDLWGAAYVINGGCGDDTFDDFRTSLISRGRATLDKALSDPDSLADEDYDPELWFYEGFQYDVSEAVEARAGRYPHDLVTYRQEPLGTSWSDEDLPRLYPRLALRFARPG
jgi:hypothetical protein